MNILSDSEFEKYRNILYKQVLNKSIKWAQGILRGSGRPAGWTIDVREEIFTPYYANIIAELFMKWIDYYKPDYVAGLATTGGFLASQLSLLSSFKNNPVKALYIRKSPKINGLQKQIEGPIEGKSTVIIVDDAINSGTSAVEAIKLLSDAKCVPVAFLSILNFENDGMELLEKLNIPLHSLYTLKELGLKAPVIPENPDMYSLLWQAGSVSSGIYRDHPGSEPVFSEGRLFINSDRGSFLSLRTNGEPDWECSLESPGLSTPLYGKGKVYFNSSGGFLYCAMAKSGKILWKNKVGEGTGFSSPIFSPDKKAIILSSYEDETSGCLFLINTQDGSLLRSFDLKSKLEATPAVSALHNCIITGANDGTLYSLHMSGAIKWTSNIPGEIKSSIAVDDKSSSCYFASCDGSLYCLDLMNGRKKWQTFLSNIDYGRPVIAGKRILLSTSSGFLYCLHSHKGDILWQRSLGLWKRPSFPALFKDRVYIGNRDGDIMVFSLLQGKLLWKFSTGSPINSSPSVYPDFPVTSLTVPDFNSKIFNIHNNRIYIMNSGGFIEIYNFEFNRFLWSFNPCESGNFENALIVSSGNGYLYCFVEKSVKSER